MKFLALFFSFYLLALSTVPCSDTFNSAENHNNTTFSASHEHSGETTDFCSPFCICHCCNSPVISKFRAALQIAPKMTFNSNLQFPLRNISIVLKYSGPIWHPPQLTV